MQLVPEWKGNTPTAAELIIRERAGCDLLPLDPKSHTDCTRLLSYIWADQTDRIERTRAALEMAQQEQIKVEKADVLDWLEKRLAGVKGDTAHVIYHTIVWPYLSKESQNSSEAMIRAAGEQASKASPLA